MCGCCETRIVQLGGASTFTFNVSAGTGPIPGGPVTTGPLIVTNNDTLHIWSAGTIGVQVIPGSVNIGLTAQNILRAAGAPGAGPADVASPALYVNSTTHQAYYWNGAAWVLIVAAADVTNQSFVTNVNWDFNNNDWTITDIDQWSVTANDIAFNTNTFEVTSNTVNYTGYGAQVYQAHGLLPVTYKN